MNLLQGAMAMNQTCKMQRKSPKTNEDEIDGIFEKGRKRNIISPLPKAKTSVDSESNEKGRFTEEGFRILKWSELISCSAGDSELCPFDCKCCF